MTRPLPRKNAVYAMMHTTNDPSTAIHVVRQANDQNAYRSTGMTVSDWATRDFSHLPTTDPGGGQVWLKAGNLHVGP